MTQLLLAIIYLAFISLGLLIPYWGPRGQPCIYNLVCLFLMLELFL